MILMVVACRERNGPRTREKLLDVIRASPGLTKTELMRRADLAWGTVHYHLHVLQRNHQVIRKRKFGWARIYIADAGDELLLMPLMRVELVAELVGMVRQTPGIGIQALSKTTGASRRVVRRHLLNLVETGVLEKSADYRPRFQVKSN